MMAGRKEDKGMSKPRYYYVRVTEAHAKIMQITRQQIKTNCFVNISVKSYRGKKYDPLQTVVVVVG